MSIFKNSLDTFYIWWRSVDRTLLVALGILIILGLVLLMAASPPIAERLNRDNFFFVKRQVFYLLISCGVIVFISSRSKEICIIMCLVGYIFTILALIYVLAFGMQLNGARSWISLGFFALQPSEFLKPFLAVVSAWILTNKKLNYFKSLSLSFVLFAVPVILVLSQPDFGMSVVITAIWLIQVFLSKVSIYWIVLAFVLLILMLAFGYVFLPHVASRIDRFIDPTSGDNEQNIRSLEAFISGGFFGKGPGGGIIKNHLPDSHTDFIFAVAAEELGILFCMLLVILFCFIIIRVFQRLSKFESPFLVIAIVGLVSQFALQAIVNTSVCLGIIPNTGMTLPFISYGGSSTLSLAISFGLILALNKVKYERG